MKKIFKTRLFLLNWFSRFMMICLIALFVVASLPWSELYAESMIYDDSSQVSDWIAKAKLSIWGEYPTAREPWPVHETSVTLAEPEMLNRSKPESLAEPAPKPTTTISNSKLQVPAVLENPAPDPVPEPVVIAVKPADSWISEIVKLTNVARKENGLSELVLNSELCKAADIRASELPSSPAPHLRPNGDPFYTVLTEISLSVSASGENYAIDPSEDSSPERIVNAWLNSPSHRKNILNSTYTSIAISRVIKNGNTYIEQLFAG